MAYFSEGAWGTVDAARHEVAGRSAPDQLIAIAATIAAELPAAAARLGAGRSEEAMCAAIGLGVAIDDVIAQPAGTRLVREEVAQLAADLAGRIGLLLLDAAIEAAVAADDPEPQPSIRADQAVQVLLDGIVAIRDQMGFTGAADLRAA